MCRWFGKFEQESFRLDRRWKDRNRILVKVSRASKTAMTGG